VKGSLLSKPKACCNFLILHINAVYLKQSPKAVDSASESSADEASIFGAFERNGN